MGLITWDQSYSVNIKGVDSQHQRLVEMINNLHDAMKNGQSNNVISDILNDMVAYTIVHFKTEENLFEKYNYPAREQHKQEHTVFVNKVENFVDEFNSGNKMLSFNVSNFLNKWLIEHIKVQDKAYSKFMNEKGIN